MPNPAAPSGVTRTTTPLTSLPAAVNSAAPRMLRRTMPSAARRSMHAQPAIRAIALAPSSANVEDNSLVLDLRCLEDEAGFTANLAELALEARPGEETTT